MKILITLAALLILTPLQDDRKMVWYHANGNLKTETHFNDEWWVTSYTELREDGDTIIDMGYGKDVIFEKKRYLDLEDSVWYFDKKIGTIRMNKVVYDEVKRGDEVTVHYICFDKNGKQLDNSFRKNSPLKFICGGQSVLVSFSRAVSRFQYGQYGFIYIPSYQGYGAEQVANIPPNTDLYYFIQVLP